MSARLISVMRIAVALMAVTVLTSAAGAENWGQWRGPFLNGFTSEKGLPTTWSKTENLHWVVRMPGPGPATPIVWEDRVFVTAAEIESKKMWAICLNRSDGRELWRHEVGIGFASRSGNNGAVASPITDGKSVYFLYGTGDMVAFDMDGRVIWARNIEADHGAFNLLFGYGASPLLYNGKLYLSVLHRHTRAKSAEGQPEPMSYLLCIDPETGKDVWKHERKTDAAGESMEAYTTPYPFDGPNGTLTIVAGGDHVTAHDPHDGREVWRSGNLNLDNSRSYRLVPSAVGVDGILVFCEPRGGAVLAMDGGKSGQLLEEDLAWIVADNAPDVCTPLVMDGRLYVLDGGKRVMTCLDPVTGAVHWRGELGGRKAFQASPTGADGKIYCINMGGEVVILSAGDKFEVLSRIDMGEGECRSTISAAHGQLFVRTAENLHCIGSEK